LGKNETNDGGIHQESHGEKEGDQQPRMNNVIQTRVA
jgi:hypothetical protein